MYIIIFDLYILKMEKKTCVSWFSLVYLQNWQEKLVYYVFVAFLFMPKIKFDFENQPADRKKFDFWLLAHKIIFFVENLDFVRLFFEWSENLKELLWNKHLELSSRNLSQLITSSQARGSKNLDQPTNSREARGSRDLRQPITSSEARDLRNLGQPITSSETRYLRTLVNLSPRVNQEA